MSPIQRLSLDSGTFPLLRLIGRHGVLKRKAALSIRHVVKGATQRPTKGLFGSRIEIRRV